MAGTDCNVNVVRSVVDATYLRAQGVTRAAIDR
jgi:hypothetical protein